ncbi:MAG: 3-deoxy-manno-octulosonate cytidylyltransferase [Planctomycetes bacterium]|nr:3-deoxy-manno-octulosonate cytidylyltransferase [Planctomycetota bacterium]
MKIVGIIPARYKSSRFPGKPLAKILGKPMIYHVYEAAQKCSLLDEVIVATDDDSIYDACTELSINSILTSEDHRTGTDRVSEVAQRTSGDIYVNVQGDEPLIDPKGIDKVISEIANSPEEAVVNAFSMIDNMSDLLNKNVVKVITSRDDYALAYSRSAIPYPQDPNSIYKRQIGLYAIRRDAILKFSSLPRGYIELAENVEMFRYLENGYKIKMVEVSDDGSIPVDVPDDIQRVESLMKKRGV